MITEFYANLLQTMPEGLEQKIFEVLRWHVGKENKISLEDLSIAIFGMASTTSVRQVREAIETMRRKHVPVLSNSGTSGRWLAANKDEIRDCLYEMYNRRDALMEIIRGMETTNFPDETQHQMVLF